MCEKRNLFFLEKKFYFYYKNYCLNKRIDGIIVFGLTSKNKKKLRFFVVVVVFVALFFWALYNLKFECSRVVEESLRNESI